MIYCYAKPDSLKGHKFTDDVAVVKAMSKRSAQKKFNYLYKDVDKENIKRIKLSYNKVTILTDY
jgi:uncharacterized membrane protein YkvA (DUF1232 family)